MSLRAAIAALIVLATIGFVVGTAIERNSSESHHETPAATRSQSGTGETHAESAEHHETGRAAEGGRESGAGEAAGERHGELKPLRVDIEAAPFVALAALASLALAAAVWLRPSSLAVLGLVVAVMVAFAALDVREIFHQVDESRTGLAVLAGVVAALHLAAASGAGLLARRDQRPVRPAGTMPA